MKYFLKYSEKEATFKSKEHNSSIITLLNKVWLSQSNLIAALSLDTRLFWNLERTITTHYNLRGLIWNPEAGFYPSSNHTQHFRHPSFNCIVAKWKLLSVWLCDPMDHRVHGILQAKVLEWVAVPVSRFNCIAFT